MMHSVTASCSTKPSAFFVPGRRAPALKRSVRGPPEQRCPPLRAVGKDLLGGSGWLDLASLVSGGGQTKSVYSDLAYKIGKEVYVDIQGWHLYLKEITVDKNLKMHQALAEQLGASAGELSDTELEQILKKVPLSLGGGKQKVSLADAMPSFAVRDLSEILQDFAKNQ